MDCLTTAVGISFFGVREVNPFLVGLVNTNLSGFVALKLTVTILVGFIFLLAQETLNRTADHDSRSFTIAMKTLKLSYFVILLFLIVVVVNNVLILLRLTVF